MYDVVEKMLFNPQTKKLNLFLIFDFILSIHDI